VRRYITRPRGWLDPSWADNGVEHRSGTPTVSVFEADPSPRKTGLLDHLGNDLYAVDHMEPIGFIKRGADRR
jgi:hypothetical protein